MGVSYWRLVFTFCALKPQVWPFAGHIFARYISLTFSVSFASLWFVVMALAAASFLKPLVISVLVPFDTYRHLYDCFDEVEICLLRAIQTVFNEELRCINSAQDNNISVQCFISCTPTLHPRGKQYLVSIAGPFHSYGFPVLMRLIFAIKEQILTSVNRLFVQRRRETNWNILSHIEVEEAANVFPLRL